MGRALRGDDRGAADAGVGCPGRESARRLPSGRDLDRGDRGREDPPRPHRVRAVSMTPTTTATTCQQRRSRSDRDRAQRVRLTDRDLWILEAVGKMRFATTTQLARLHFDGSRWASNKRLRRLLDAGLLRVWIRDLAQDNVYSLAPRGARLLRDDRGDTAEESWVTPRGLDGNLDHLLAINQVRIELALSVPSVKGEIAWWRSDWELRAQGRERVIPDALFRIQWQELGEQTFALEVDNRTNSSRSFLRKILGYSAALQSRGLYGMSDFLILFVGRDSQWLERYRLRLVAVRLRPRIWFTTLAAVGQHGAGGSIWKPIDGDANSSLRDLVFFPYGK